VDSTATGTGTTNDEQHAPDTGAGPGAPAAEAEARGTEAATEAGTEAESRGTGTMAPGGRTKLVQGPGVLLLWLYAVMSVGAVSRSIYQIATAYEKAPLSYLLSAAAGVVYVFITYTLLRGGETARKVALVCCGVELVGVITVGTWTLVEPSAFADATVWTWYGLEYLLIPVILPISGILWLLKSRRGQDPVGP
jgi:hypothetical protein